MGFGGGPDFGPRYWYLMLLPLTVRSARGVQRLFDMVGSQGSIVAALGVLAISTIVVFMPWRARDKYLGYLAMRPELRRLVTDPSFRNSLTLVRGQRHPDYASAAIYNPLTWNSPAPIFAWDRNRETRAQVLHFYPDRPVWIVEGPTITGAGYRFVAGPLSAADVAGH